MNFKFLTNLFFFWKKPKAVVVVSKDPEDFKKIIFKTVGSSWLAEKEVLVLGKGQDFKLPKSGRLILEFDQEEIRNLKDKTSLKVVTFGLKEGADFQATDLKENGGINFKIVWQGKVVPFWIDKEKGKEGVYQALAAAAVGTIFGMNLVEISQKM